MTRPKRIILWILASLAGLIIVLGITVLLVVRTEWFRDYVRNKIITYAEQSTGGTVELQKFGFDWTHLHANLTGFVLHGTEPAGTAPLFSAQSIDVNLKLFTSLKHMLELDYLGVERPQVNVIVYADGHTNVPAPKVKPTSNKTVLENFVDLAIGRFKIENGAIQLGEQKTEFSVRGENLRAQLSYNMVPATYDGQLSMSPLKLQQKGRAPVDLNITLPLHLERDKVQLTNAKIATPESQLTITGELNHLVDPHESAHIVAAVSLAEVKRIAVLPITVPSNGPGVLNADLNVSMDKDHIQVASSHISLGHSNIDASGVLEEPNGADRLRNPTTPSDTFQFKASLDLDELNRLYKNTINPRGTLAMSGNATLIDSDTAEVRDLKLAGFGGTFTGNAGVQNGQRFHVEGRLGNFDIAELARMFLHENLGYDGVISGPIQASGDFKTASNLKANVHLGIAPGRHGVPVTGQLNADYNAAADTIDLERSYIALPNTRLDLTGSIGKQVQIKLVSHNLNDFLPAMQMGKKNGPKEMPIALQKGGAMTFTGAVTGKLNAPRLAGHAAVTNFEAQQRTFDSLTADLSASPSGAAVQNGALVRGRLEARFDATVGLRNWSAPPSAPLSLNAAITNADIADLLALANQNAKDISGTVNANAKIGGTIGDPRGAVNLTVANLTAYNEHFDQLAGQVNLTDRLITIPDMRLTAGQNAIDLTATYQHAADSLEKGTLHATLKSNTMQLAQFEAVKKGTPQLTGTMQINADLNATVDQVNKETQFLVSSVNADASARGLKYEGTNYGDFTAKAQTSGNVVNYDVTSDFAGSSIRATGNTRLVREYPTTAKLNINNLQVEKILAVAGRKDIPFTGVLSTNAQLSGTLDDPHANADLRLTNATYYEHFDLIQGHVDYSKQAVNIPSLEVRAGSGRAQLTANFVPQPPGQFEAGRLTFKLNTNQVQLAQFKTLQEKRPGIGGVVQVDAEGAATLANAPGKPPVLFSNLNANASATGLSMNKKAYGDLKLTASTKGSDLVFNLDSDFAGSKIHGDGRAALTDDYPVNANLNFSNVRYANLREWIGTTDSLQQANFDAVVDGTATVSGPLRKTEDLKGSVRLPRLEVTAKPRGRATGGATDLVLHNEGPIVASLDRSVIRVDSAHIVGPKTDISVTGTATLEPKQDLNLAINATTNLALLQDFNRDIYSSGVVVLQTSVRGPLTDPQMNGRVQLQNASLNMIDAPNGISNANGVILLSGNTATIQSLTGESGGGKISANGSVNYAKGILGFQLGATANQVRVRYPEGASTVADANVKLTGNTDNSTLSGTVTIARISFNPRSDFGAMLSSAATPVQTPAAPSPLLENMHLQVQVQTAPDVALQTALAQNVQLVANLRVRGTAATPGVLGRVNITQGQLVFFGTKYTVNQGSIAFYDPTRIEPVLNVDLETNVQGVDVILSVTGPADNMKLAYRSDPPLQFNEVVSLLATGKAPTSDPVLAAHAPSTPPQSTQQMGESALLAQAINPVAGQLQRVFGVSQLKIAPAFVSGSGLPQARMTLEQQVTQNVTFTYQTDLTNANEQVIKVEWAMNRNWSAVMTRDENGIFSVDFFYKRKIK